MEFEFGAVRLSDAKMGRLRIIFATPVPVDASPQDYQCGITFTGVIELSHRAYGAYPFQALELAISMAKSLLASYSNEWCFDFEGQGPILFGREPE